MTSLGNYIKIFFQDAEPEKIIDVNFSKGNLSYKNIQEKEFNEYSFICYPQNSQNERSQYYNDLTDFLKKENSVFKLLVKFGEECLEFNNHIPVVNFDEILQWRSITHLIGQAVIVTAYLASCSVEDGIEYDYWAWPTVLGTNNRQLQNILNKGLSENHFHLNGSTQIFPITWISIMNDPRLIKNRIKKINTNLYPRYIFSNGDKTSSWEELLLISSYIRIKLFCKINDLENLLNCKGVKECNDVNLLYENISRISYLFGFKQEDGKCLDYALTDNLGEYNYLYNRILVGERKFLYDCFKASFSSKFNDEDNNLLYYYLLVKNRFRAEMIQANNMVGFKNFSNYQDRKNLFFYGLQKYEKEAVKLSLNDTIENQSIDSLEARIMPKKSLKKLVDSLNFYDKIFKNTKQNNAISLNDNYNHLNCKIFKENEIRRFDEVEYFEYPYKYILHYPKGISSCSNANDYNFKCRNSLQRKNNKKCSLTIVNALSDFGSVQGRICGIDACSNEIGCRPEVFATDYRYIKKYNLLSKSLMNKNVKNNNIIAIGRTYHVGEDFLDLVDGIRAIDEVIKFLEFTQGDRLGHALALGLIPKEYYKYKNNRIILPQQDALDNFLWLYYRSAELNISIEPLLKNKIRQKIDVLMRNIYGDFCKKNDLNITPFDLFEAWKLRGDHPELYKYGYYQEPVFPITKYQKSMCKKSSDLEILRGDKKVNLLYYAYHYDKNVRNSGETPFEYYVEDIYVNLIEQIQAKFKFDIAHRGIMIECNPSSNCLISTFREYSKHPLMNFNNIGLELDYKKIAMCPQISVSINTDDQGVFDTSLEYEYALMASALIEMRDINGDSVYSPEQVYNYLDNVRKMGNVQSF